LLPTTYFPRLISLPLCFVVCFWFWCFHKLWEMAAFSLQSQDLSLANSRWKNSGLWCSQHKE
jgi:hypothetical protein